MKFFKLFLIAACALGAFHVAHYFGQKADHAEQVRKDVDQIHARAMAHLAAAEAELKARDAAKAAKAARDKEQAAADAPLPKSVLSPFIAPVGADGGLRMIALGMVSKEIREKEGLMRSCLAMECRRLTYVESYGEYVQVQYQAVTPRELTECPSGTSFMMDTTVYRAAEGICKQEAQGAKK